MLESFPIFELGASSFLSSKNDMMFLKNAMAGFTLRASQAEGVRTLFVDFT
jgi:hypothetical protein